jgi:hypothetical protein
VFFPQSGKKGVVGCILRPGVSIFFEAIAVFAVAELPAAAAAGLNYF